MVIVSVASHRTGDSGLHADLPKPHPRAHYRLNRLLYSNVISSGGDLCLTSTPKSPISDKLRRLTDGEVDSKSHHISELSPSGQINILSASGSSVYLTDHLR